MIDIYKILEESPESIKSLLEGLDGSGELSIILPELVALKGVDTTKKSYHKDNYIHTLGVIENTYYQTNNIWLRLVAILHDIGKATTKKWDDEIGWSFHNHELTGGYMLKKIFKRLSLPVDKYDYVYKLIINHGLPKELSKSNVTESALRRFGLDLGEDLEDLILFCKCDITTRNLDNKNKHISNYTNVYNSIIEIRNNDELAKWRSPIDGIVIMQYFGVKGRDIGIIKSKIETAIKSGEIGDNYDEAFEYMKNIKL